MCVGLPGKVLRITDEEHSLVEVEIGENVHQVSAAILTGEGEEVEPGDWLEIHSGHALAKLSPDEAEEMLDHIRALDEAHQAALEGRMPDDDLFADSPGGADSEPDD